MIHGHAAAAAAALKPEKKMYKTQSRCVVSAKRKDATKPAEVLNLKPLI